jgi:hypothetical protein
MLMEKPRSKWLNFLDHLDLNQKEGAVVVITIIILRILLHWLKHQGHHQELVLIRIMAKK